MAAGRLAEHLAGLRPSQRIIKYLQQQETDDIFSVES
jgi:hypothetical protein